MKLVRSLGKLPNIWKLNIFPKKTMDQWTNLQRNYKLSLEKLKWKTIYRKLQNVTKAVINKEAY